ncbi:MAG: type II toxin-antitoxin system HicA family toxin [Tepidisphaeraceae bacterium]
MPPFGPISRRDLIQALRRAGFSGPVPGAAHEVMISADGRRLSVPNPHRRDVGKALLMKILRKASISREQWEQL